MFESQLEAISKQIYSQPRGKLENLQYTFLQNQCNLYRELKSVAYCRKAFRGGINYAGGEVINPAHKLKKKLLHEKKYLRRSGRMIDSSFPYNKACLRQGDLVVKEHIPSMVRSRFSSV